MSPKIVLLNGPPGCGKDFAGKTIEIELFVADRPRVRIVKFAESVKVGTHAAHELYHSNGSPLPHDQFEDSKDQPIDWFFGKTPRAAYIAFSEAFMKPLHGPRIFGQLLLRSIRFSQEADVYVVTDSGFREEAEVLVEHFGAGNCFLARIHREGKTFDGDSRNWVYLDDLGVTSLDVDNPGNPEGLRGALAPVLEWIRK